MPLSLRRDIILDTCQPSFSEVHFKHFKQHQIQEPAFWNFQILEFLGKQN